MSNISDNIQETIEQQISNKLNSKVAMLVAIIATFMALCDVKNGNLVQEMSQAQAPCIDAWGYFQAKSTKQAIYENSL